MNSLHSESWYSKIINNIPTLVIYFIITVPLLLIMIYTHLTYGKFFKTEYSFPMYDPIIK